MKDFMVSLSNLTFNDILGPTLIISLFPKPKGVEDCNCQEKDLTLQKKKKCYVFSMHLEPPSSLAASALFYSIPTATKFLTDPS